jgi:uncharacterized protein
VILGALFLAAVCWAITFGWAGGNFWIKIGLSVLAVLFYSLFWQKPKISYQFRSLAVGFLSALVLYLVFFLGNAFAPYVLHAANVQVGGIYSLGVNSNKVLVFLLLFFVTGPGEEIFWRGFLQDRLMKKWGNGVGLITATVAYGGVHVFSGNLMLILAALVAGAFWGLLYLWKRDLLIQIVSHSLWSAVIFVVAPVR